MSDKVYTAYKVYIVISIHPVINGFGKILEAADLPTTCTVRRHSCGFKFAYLLVGNPGQITALIFDCLDNCFPLYTSILFTMMINSLRIYCIFMIDCFHILYMSNICQLIVIIG